MNLTKEFFQQWKPRTKEVTLPELGSVYVRELRASEVMNFSKQQTTDPTNAVYSLIVMGTVNENGEQLFGMSDLSTVGGLPYVVSDAIFAAILDFNGLNVDAKKKQTDDSK